MLDGSAGSKIWLIDRREYWREPFARALRQVGLDVTRMDRYDEPLKRVSDASLPELVVLACTAVTYAELGLVKWLAHRGHDILVLVAALPPETMRELFLAGAYDVTEMPVTQEGFVALVMESLKDARSGREHKAVAPVGL